MPLHSATLSLSLSFSCSARLRVLGLVDFTALITSRGRDIRNLKRLNRRKDCRKSGHASGFSKKENKIGGFYFIARERNKSSTNDCKVYMREAVGHRSSRHSSNVCICVHNKHDISQPERQRFSGTGKGGFVLSLLLVLEEEKQEACVCVCVSTFFGVARNHYRGSRSCFGRDSGRYHSPRSLSCYVFFRILK